MTHNLNPELEELLEELREYRADMVARNYPFQRISNIITVWEMKKVPKRDFLEEAEKKGLSPESNRWLRRIKNQETLTGVVIA